MVAFVDCFIWPDMKVENNHLSYRRDVANHLWLWMKREKTCLGPSVLSRSQYLLSLIFIILVRIVKTLAGRDAALAHPWAG
jgi:hypothetical protein